MRTQDTQQLCFHMLPSFLPPVDSLQVRSTVDSTVLSGGVVQDPQQQQYHMVSNDTTLTSRILRCTGGNSPLQQMKQVVGQRGVEWYTQAHIASFFHALLSFDRHLMKR